MNLSQAYANEIDDEDFETILANRRLRPTVSTVHSANIRSNMEETAGESMAKQRADDNLTPSQNETMEHHPHPRVDSEMVTGMDQARSSADIELQNDFFDFNAFNKVVEPDPESCDVPSIEVPAHNRSESPLFVQPDDNKNSEVNIDEVHTVVGPRHRPDPENQSSFHQTSAHQYPAPKIPGRRPSVYKPGFYNPQATLSATMSNVFVDPNFLRQIKQNPYTTSLFSESGPSREEALASLTVQGRRQSASKRGSSPAANNKTLSHSTEKTLSQSISQLTPQPQQTPKPATIANVPNASTTPDQSRQNKRRRVADPMATSVGRDSNTTMSSRNNNTFANPPRRHRSYSLPSPAPEGSSAARAGDARGQEIQGLTQFLRGQFQKYETALEQLNVTQTTTQELWTKLANEIKPDALHFKQRLQNKQNFNAAEFERDILDWDLSLGVQTLIQKHLMYNALLQALND